MSPPDRTLRSPGARVRAWFLRRIPLRIAALALAAAPAAHAGTLSEAAKEALKPPEKQNPVVVSAPAPAPAPAGPVVVVCSDPGPSPPPRYPDPLEPPVPYHDPSAFAEWKPPPELHVGAAMAMDQLASPDFAPTTLAGIRAGIRDNGRTLVDVAVLGGQARFTAGSDLSRALRKVREMAFEGSLRFSLTPPHSQFGIAPLAGFRVGRMSWDYLNPIRLASPGLIWTVSDDAIWHYSPFFGIATSVVNTRHVDLGVTGILGYRYYDQESHQGLTNDLFPEVWFRELRLEARIVF